MLTMLAQPILMNHLHWKDMMMLIMLAQLILMNHLHWKDMMSAQLMMMMTYLHWKSNPVMNSLNMTGSRASTTYQNTTYQLTMTSLTYPIVTAWPTMMLMYLARLLTPCQLSGQPVCQLQHLWTKMPNSPSNLTSCQSSKPYLVWMPRRQSSPIGR